MFEIDKSFAHANISRTIRFTEPLFYELKALAEKENMLSFNNIVLQCCAYAISHYDGKDNEVKED